MIDIYDRAVAAFCRWLCRTFPSRCRVIPDEAGTGPKLTQFRLFDGVYLQHFHGPEQKDFFHDHRWRRMRSFVLSGEFVKERMLDHRFTFYNSQLFRHRRFETYTMTSGDRHRVDEWGEHCWTLFMMGPVVHPGWGYYRRWSGDWTIWSDHIRDELKIANLETGVVTGRGEA